MCPLCLQLCDLYENDSIFDKFECCLSGDGMRVATGSYRYIIYVSRMHVKSCCCCAGQLLWSSNHLERGISLRNYSSRWMRVLWVDDTCSLVDVWWLIRLCGAACFSATCSEYLVLALEVKRHPLWRPAKVQIGIFLHLDADATVNLWLCLIRHCDLDEENWDCKDTAECRSHYYCSRWFTVNLW